MPIEILASRRQQRLLFDPCATLQLVLTVVAMLELEVALRGKGCHVTRKYASSPFTAIETVFPARLNLNWPVVGIAHI